MRQNDFQANGMFGANSEPICAKITNISKWTERASTGVSSPRSTIRCVQMISDTMVRLAQTVHLSCTNTNTVSN
jgi:hypothetical protein